MAQDGKSLSNGFIQVITASVRPAVTIMFAAGLVDCLVNGITPPTWFLSLAVPIISWWFVERAVKHRAERR